MKHLMALLCIMLFMSNAEARKFSKQEFYLSLSYSHILTGTRSIVPSESITVHYSRDRKFCLALFNNMELECTYTKRYGHDNRSIYEINIPMSGFSELVELMINDKRIDNNIQTRILELASSNKDSSSKLVLNKQDSREVQMHDDENPDSIHVKIQPGDIEAI